MSRAKFSSAAAWCGVLVLLAGLAVFDRDVLWPSMAWGEDSAPPPAAAKPPAKSKAAPAAARHAKHAEVKPKGPATGPAQPGLEGKQAKGEKSQGKKYSAAANVRKIRAALKSPTEMDFNETPLQDVFDYLKDFHGIEIQIDKKALDDVGIDPKKDTFKDVHLKGIALRSALRLMLRELDLTYMIENEVLLITTPEEASNRLVTMVYPVGDLVTYRDKNGELWEDYDTLIETITCTVMPCTWDSVGGPGGIAPGTFSSAKVLVVSQREEVQEEIASLLRKLRGIIKHSGQKPEPPLRDRPHAESKGQEKCRAEAAGGGGQPAGASAGKKK